MNSLRKQVSDRPSIDSARTLAERWRQAQPTLEQERLQRLQKLSERDAALQFARLLQIRGTWPLRPSSGLVEQQRILARLRKQT